MVAQTLNVSPGDSPSSSIFDLPTQPEVLRNSSLIPGPSAQRPTIQVQAQHQPSDRQPSFLVISGGTGGNTICSAFGNACYVLPVSDDGGSSSEIIRVLGGPSIGDIRSRLVRLIPTAPDSSPLHAIRRLLAYRLPSESSEKHARDEWREIVEGRSNLWKGISTDRKETIRGFLVYFESELLRRAHKKFDFRNGSIGNCFLAAAQHFFRSLPSAIFLFSSITNSQANILPVIVTNHTVTIAAELADGQRLIGQCEISHPVVANNFSFSFEEPGAPSSPIDGLAELISPKPNVMFESTHKETYEPLPSRIARLFYINGYGMEIHPTPNPDFITNAASRDILVYSCGSLWTSIIPCLALKGVARAIARSPTLRAKILLLNGENDRETDGYSAADYLFSLAQILNTDHSDRAYGLGGANTTYPISAFVTDLVYLKGTRVMVDTKRITEMGVRCREIEGGTRFDAGDVQLAMKQVWSEVCGGDQFSTWHFPVIDKVELTVENRLPDTRTEFPTQPMSWSDDISARQLQSRATRSTEITDLAPQFVQGRENTPRDRGYSSPKMYGPTSNLDTTLGTACDEPNHPNTQLMLAHDGNDIDFPAPTPSTGAENSYEELQIALSGNPTDRPVRVRFRPRVRITSGLNRHRHSARTGQEQDYVNFSPGSSMSGSPSSSISAPLRTPEDDEAGKPGWGPLGQRVALFAQGKVRRQAGKMNPTTELQDDIAYTRGIHEHTPLLDPGQIKYLHNAGIRANYNMINPRDQDGEDDVQQPIEFGQWPNRIMNYHWWWYQMEPVVCCRCLTDSDEEG